MRSFTWKACVRGLALIILALGLGSSSSPADDLTKGVLLVHHPVGLQYSLGTDYCAYAHDSLSFPNCWEDVNPSVPADTTSSVWYVIAAWGESKAFAGIEFGFGSYDEDAYVFTDYGPCFPSAGMEIPDGDWPGPLTGTTLTATTTPWEGEFVPVYYFAGYGYAESEIAIQGRQSESVAKAANTLAEEYEIRPSRCGVLGIGREGVTVCPSQSSLQEVLAWLGHGEIALPDSTTHASIEEVEISSSSIYSLLTAYSITHVARTYPDAVRDTVGFINRLGKVVYLSDLTTEFTLIAADSAAAESLSALLEDDKSILRACPNGGVVNYLGAVYPSEFDHLSPMQIWHLHNDRVCESSIDIDAPQAWYIDTGDPAIRVAILDAPVDVDHPDLRFDTAQSCGPLGSDHGTQVAGMVAAETDNDGIGIAAVDWDATVRCYDTPHYESPPGIAEIIAAVRQAVVDGADVLNCSWFVDEPYAPSIKHVFVDACKAGALVVAAGGNADTQPALPYPARWDHGILSVGAIDCDGVPQEWICDEHRDVAAPGVDIYTTCSYDPENCPDEYITVMGTSLAAPIVSGVCSLLLSYAYKNNLPLVSDDVMQLIRIGAVDVGEEGWDECSGWGCVNAFNSLDILANPAAHVFRLRWDDGEGNSSQAVGTDIYSCAGVPVWPSGEEFYGPAELTQYVVTKQVYFGGGGFDEPHPVVWGRGAAMYGLGLDNFSPDETIYGYGYCDTLGTSAVGAILRTWVYYDVNEEHWLPCPPEEVTWHYGVYSDAAWRSSIGDGSPGLFPGEWGIWVRSPQVDGARFDIRIPHETDIELRIYDVLGRCVREIRVNGMSAGRAEVSWDGRDYAGKRVGGGLYWVRVITERGTVTKRFLTLR